jgi:hypothetical protein
MFSRIYRAVEYVFFCPGHALTFKTLATFSVFNDSRKGMIIKLDGQTGTQPFSLYVLACKEKLKLNLFFAMRSGSQILYAFFCPVHAQTIQETCNSFYFYPFL